jgi:hypothetical protein
MVRGGQGSRPLLRQLNIPPPAVLVGRKKMTSGFLITYRGREAVIDVDGRFSDPPAES